MRAGLVDTLMKLDWYRWCGHSVVMGRRENEWQDRDYVLGWFGTKKGAAKSAYRQFVKMGVVLGKQPHLIGGGLIRSLGGWSQVKALRRIGDRELSDERVLGSGKFIEQLIGEVDLVKKYRLTASERSRKAVEAIEEACSERGVFIEALRGGSRRRSVAQIRSELSTKLVNEHGLTFAETARQLGVSTSAISKILNRKKNK